MALSDTKHSARLPLPDLIVRGQDHTVSCPLYLDAALVAPSSGTVSVYDASGTAIVDGAAVTVSGSVATYQIPAATTASLTVGMGWRVEWSLVVSGVTGPDDVVLARNDAALVRHPLNNPISDFDIFRRVRALDPSTTSVIHSETTFQDQIDEAWCQVQLLLLQQGNRPNLIMSPSSLREVTLLATLALIYDSLDTRANPVYGQKAESYRLQFRDAWGNLSFAYDTDDDGVADNNSSRTSAVRTLWLGGR